MLVSQQSSGKYVLLGGMLLVGLTACAVFFITSLDRRVKDATQEIQSQAATIGLLQQQVSQLTQELSSTQQERDAALRQSQTYSQALQDTQLEQNKVQLENQGLKAANEALHRQLDIANANSAARTQTSPSQPAAQPANDQPANAEPPSDTAMAILPGVALSITPLLSLLAGIRYFFVKRKQNIAHLKEQVVALQMHNARLGEEIMDLQMYNTRLTEKLAEMRQRHRCELEQVRRLSRPQ